MSSASLSSTLHSLFPHIALHLICACLIFYWLGRVNSVVPDPYLDEVFHVRQAQTYWAGQWSTWNPKITTPPGLYLWSYALLSPFKAVGAPFELNAPALRITNALANAAILLATLQSLLHLNCIPNSQAKAHDPTSSALKASKGWRLDHTALNICLFPPLFFFTGLYYTDLLSALTVFAAYRSYASIRVKHEISDSSLASEHVGASVAYAHVLLWLCGLLSLLFRQTNIFWVSVYLGGLEVVRVVKHDSKECTASDISDILSSSLYNGDIYDPQVNGAKFEDYLKTGLSLAFACPARLQHIASSIVPFVSFLIAFAAFVVWNGSVVLGHKEYHSASLHLSQMLYIWPYIMFFSWPLILPYLLDAIFPPRFVPGTLRYRGLTKSLPRARVTVPLLLTMFLIVRFNTIIHPFTLADNRHYIFYVFRIFRRHFLIKYLAVPIYLSCGWLAIVALGGPATEDERIEAKNLDARGKKSNKRGALKSAPPAAAGNKVSVVIVWFVSMALSLITAPLVEPRYFIIPWIMWRLHVFPAPTDSNTRTDKPQRTSTMLSRLQYSFRNYDHRLYLETIWYLMVNFVTGYVFLYRGFSWPQEPGNVQRFIW